MRILSRVWFTIFIPSCIASCRSNEAPSASRLVAPAPSSSQCRQVEHGGRQYLVCNELRNYEQAKNACQSRSMRLASIDTQEENQFISRLSKHPVLVDLNDQSTPGVWKWSSENRISWCGSNKGHPWNSKIYNNWADKEPLPEANCVTLHPDGFWRSSDCSARNYYVCETDPDGRTKPLNGVALDVRESVRAGKLSVGHVTFSDKANIADPFSAYGSRLGLRDCVDTLEPVGEPHEVPDFGTRAQNYQQFYRGIPVVSGAYVVHRDRTTGRVKHFTGKIEPGIDVDIVPTIDEATAYRFALQAIPASARDYARAPHGNLVIHPTRQDTPTDWVLVWQFKFPATPVHDETSLAISAHNGRLIAKVSLSRSGFL
jgi:hypothetical protein